MWSMSSLGSENAVWCRKYFTQLLGKHFFVDHPVALCMLPRPIMGVYMFRERHGLSTEGFGAQVASVCSLRGGHCAC